MEARKINGVAFDGSKDITITAVANAANAANATAADKLTTARKINGVDFDGSKDITIDLPVSIGNVWTTDKLWVE